MYSSCITTCKTVHVRPEPLCGIKDSHGSGALGRQPGDSFLEKPFFARSICPGPAICHLLPFLHLELVLQLLGGQGESFCNRGWQLLSKLDYPDFLEEAF